MQKESTQNFNMEKLIDVRSKKYKSYSWKKKTIWQVNEYIKEPSKTNGISQNPLITIKKVTNNKSDNFQNIQKGKNSPTKKDDRIIFCYESSPSRERHVEKPWKLEHK